MHLGDAKLCVVAQLIQCVGNVSDIGVKPTSRKACTRVEK